MEVKDKIMYHYHKLWFYDDIWQEGNEIIVDNNFNSYYGSIVDKFTTGVKCKNGIFSLDRVIDEYIDDVGLENVDLNTIEDLLKCSSLIIKNINIYNRELMLEKCRLDNNPNLPSRLHSIWLSDKESLNFWKEQVRECRKVVLFRVSITGELFKSSDSFIPNDELTTKEMYEASSIYWNPNFKEEDLCKAEYLFQGTVKVLKKINSKWCIINNKGVSKNERKWKKSNNRAIKTKYKLSFVM